MPKSDGRLTVTPVSATKAGHCAIPGKYLPGLLSSLPTASSSVTSEESYFAEMEEDFEFEGYDPSAQAEAFDDEWLEEPVGEEENESGIDELEIEGKALDEGEEESSRQCPESEASDFEDDELEVDELGVDELEVDDEDETSMEAFAAFADLEEEEEESDASFELEDEESFDEEEADVIALEEEVLQSSGLTPAELKAVQITSTLETGKPGGFYGLSGNFDGQGLSFGLVNWTIGTGSLQPLLRDFAREARARWNATFGPDASPS